MSMERDKYLTEAMGYCYHEALYIQPYHDCTQIARCRCGSYSEVISGFSPEFKFYQMFDFSTWETFGHLLKWIKTHDRFEEFKTIAYVNMWCPCGECGTEYLNWELIDPESFANKVYDFLLYLEEEYKRGIKQFGKM